MGARGATAIRVGEAVRMDGDSDAVDQADLGRRQPGRPRDPRADGAIVAAVLELLVEVGFGRLTIDAVAQRAGVGKATIYRRWEGKEQLVLDAIATETQPISSPDTGDVRRDLIQIYAPMGEPVAQQAAVRLMPALAAEAAVNPELAAQLRLFVGTRRGPARAALQLGIERGQVAADADLELCMDLLNGSLLYRLFFSGAEVDNQVIERAIDVVLDGIAP